MATPVECEAISEIDCMIAHRMLALTSLGLLATAGAAMAGPEWRKYTNPATGLSVDIPVTVFSEDGGEASEGTGRVFFTGDRRANLTAHRFPIQRTIRRPGFSKNSGRRPASSTRG